MNTTPPFTITPLILKLSQDISHQLGLIEGTKLDQGSPKLRRLNNIQTIQASLAIEGNSLNIQQVTDIFDGKRVLGPLKDIVEVKNAIEVYNSLTKFNPLLMKDFLKAHQILMKDLIDLKGKWRSGNIGVFKGEQVVHIAPSAKMVPQLMLNLFDFISKNKEIPWLIKACVFHYELEFIHPFSDGNGRMGRLWQQVLLMKEHPVFEYIHVEALIRENQDRYYEVLNKCDKEGNSTLFIEFSLEQILKSLETYWLATKSVVNDPSSRLEYMRVKVGNSLFSKKDYLERSKAISSATASRDLKFGLTQGILIAEGRHNQTRYRFK